MKEKFLRKRQELEVKLYGRMDVRTVSYLNQIYFLNENSSFRRKLCSF